MEVRWKKEPEAHDYPAAHDYLSLLFHKGDVTCFLDDFARAKVKHRKAKDILRASGLPTLGFANPHVARDLEKIKQGEELSPVLLVVGQPLTIADGYHRVCAVYYMDEDADIPCKLV